MDSTWQLTKKKIVEKHLIDDETTPRNDGNNREKVTTIATAILLIVGGGFSAFISSYVGIYSELLDRLVVEAYGALGEHNIILMTFKVLSGFIVFFAGIHLFLNRKDPERAATVREKISFAYILMVIGFFVTVVAMFISKDPTALGLIIKEALYNPYPFLGLPFVWVVCYLLKKRLEGRKSSIAAFVIAYLLALPATIYVIFYTIAVLV